MELREKLKEALNYERYALECPNGTEDAIDRILAIPELDPTPTKHRILAMLGGLRDNMSPAQIKTVQWFADQFPNA